MPNIQKTREIIFLNTQIKVEKSLLIIKMVDYCKKIAYRFCALREKWVIDTG